MPTSPEGFAESLRKLTAKFDADKTHYLSKDYLEAQARMDFITPFFKALGWDVENEAGLQHHDREVLVERGDMETTGRPDYSFRIAAQTKFFVEAKSPSEPLAHPRHILQAKAYVWNTKSVYFVILSNFQEFHFYDASAQPDPKRPDEGLLLSLRYSDYLANAEKLWEFSRERVAAGSLDALLPKIRRAPRLRKQVDDVFLDEMTGWREELAKNIHRNNPELTARQLNEVVQRLLDRIVFIRIAEDRRVLEYALLQRVVEDWEIHGGKFHIFEWLNDLFHKVNEDFNGEIFKPHLSEEIKVDSELLARIIKRLYPPESPYRFDVIGVELLGSIYERYLGNTIRLTPKLVKVEEKPEVRKAGGVYYTPRYIVDYIVRETVGKAIEGKSPKQIEKIRILDPACGSGSFLIGAFQYLIDYHARYLTQHPKEAHIHPLFPDLIRGENGEPRLSVVRKARILKNNLFGVDIDSQAVEITMMSLYLKALEGEKAQLPPKQHLLPELKGNIVCGNSLIGPDVYDQGTFFGDEERDRINAFGWQSAFPDIMKAGGFDAVIGNPPYIRVQTLQEWAPFEVEFYKQQYRAAGSGNYDIYVVFVEKGLSLLKKDGTLGFILPHKFFNAKYGEPLRSLIAKGKHLSEVVHFGDKQVFEGATNYTCLLFLKKSGCEQVEFVKVDDLDAWRSTGKGDAGTVSAVNVSGKDWNFPVGNGAQLFKKLARMPVKLADVVARIGQGIRTSANEVYVLDLVSVGSDLVTAYSKLLDREVLVERGAVLIFLQGREIKPYAILPATQVVLFPYRVTTGTVELLDASELAARFPKAWRYLLDNKRHLESREKGRFRGPQWYMFGRQQNIDLMSLPKILVPDIADRASFAFDQAGDYAFTSGYGITLKETVVESPKYILGLLNSRALDRHLKNVSTPLRGGFFRYFTQFVEQLPIRTIDFSKPADKSRHDRVVTLVDRMLNLNTQKHSGKLAPSQTDRVDREIATTDAEIDELVYELYGITDEERRIIEGG
ncbi:MAG: Eco57I restriction-modification methylase domain-containing protein [Terriglobia bacterium]